jgi:hypothetical protein
MKQCSGRALTAAHCINPGIRSGGYQVPVGALCAPFEDGKNCNRLSSELRKKYSNIQI